MKWDWLPAAAASRSSPILAFTLSWAASMSATVASSPGGAGRARRSEDALVMMSRPCPKYRAMSVGFDLNGGMASSLRDASRHRLSALAMNEALTRPLAPPVRLSMPVCMPAPQALKPNALAFALASENWVMRWDVAVAVAASSFLAAALARLWAAWSVAVMAPMASAAAVRAVPPGSWTLARAAAWLSAAVTTVPTAVVSSG